MPPEGRTAPAQRGREVAKVFAHFGWSAARRRGSHIILVKADHMATLSVPDHKQVARGTLRSLVRAAGLTVDQFEVEARKL